MLNKYGPEYFEELRIIGQNRLEPGNLTMFIWGSLVVIGLMVGMSALGLNDDVFIQISWLPALADFAKGYLVFHLVFAVFFSFGKVIYKFQRLQIVLVTVMAIVLSIATYLFFLVLYNYSFASEFVLTGALILFIGGFVFLILSTIRAFRRVGKGAFKEDGPGMFDFRNSKGYFSLPFVFAVTVMAGLIARAAGDVSADAQMYGILGLAVVLQYLFAIVIPEFFLLIYCKFRFKSFVVERY